MDSLVHRKCDWMRAVEGSSEARVLGLGPLLYWSKVSAILDLGMFWAQVLMS